jgi:AraC-like DNA-binding protein
LLDTYGLRGVHHIPDVNVEQVFREGCEACRDDPSQAEQVIAIALHKIIMQVAAELRSRREPTARQSQELRDYLDRCVRETPSLAKMAKIMGRSESQTIRTFKREWGLTPYQFLIERKLQKARVLLTGTAKAVKEIAAELGFNDEYHFSALFKQKVGLSPKHFRKAVEHGGEDSRTAYWSSTS